MRAGGFAAAAAAAAVALLTLPAASSAAPASVTDPPGLVYLVGPNGSRHFHPLGSFGQLNAAVTAKQPKRVERLSNALLARAEEQGPALVWKYRLPSYQRPPWASGLAQAVAAQALARAGRIEQAKKAYKAIPNGLVMNLPQGPWIRLYSYSDMVVLNAQLQASLSIAEYARLAGDPPALQLARNMRQAAAALMPRFDTGTWSRYSLDGANATLEYHEFVTELLWKLHARTGNELWQQHAARLRDYRWLPPKLTPGAPPDVVYPTPRDGHRDSAVVSFTLSKPATVKFEIAGRVWSASFGSGPNTWTWTPNPGTAVGHHVISATAIDWLGNTGVSTLGQAVVAKDATPPSIVAELTPWQLYWSAVDDESPWLTLRLRLTAPGRAEVVKLGRAALSGAMPLAHALDPAWTVTLIATDSSGNATWIPLGRAGDVPALGRPFE